MPTAYTDATRKPVTRYAARIMCGTSYGTAALKITLSGSTLVTSPLVGEKPPRLVHPRVDGHDRVRAAEPRDRDRHAGPEVRPRRQPLPSEDVDRDEDRLEEEEDPLDREEHPEDRAEAAGEGRPQQPELERQHRPCHGAHRERHGDDLGPAPGEQQRVGVAVAQPAVVGDQHDRREGHAERRENDMEAQRERHLAPRRLELRGERDGGGHGPTVCTSSPAGVTRLPSCSWRQARRGPRPLTSPDAGDERSGARGQTLPRATPAIDEGKAMSRPFKGTINIDERDSIPDWEPYLQPVAPPGAPNVLYVVLDDTGFSAMEPWGGLIETPNINALAATGLTYTN